MMESMTETRRRPVEPLPKADAARLHRLVTDVVMAERVVTARRRSLKAFMKRLVTNGAHPVAVAEAAGVSRMTVWKHTQRKSPSEPAAE